MWTVRSLPNAVAVGNSETVFITVDAGDEVEAVDGSIVDVNGVVTGIQEANVELEYYNDLELYNNERDEMVFAVYDSRGYIEYAVVVGTSASSNDYVYLTSGTENHGYDGSNYYWNYTGITKDGEITFRSYTSEDQNDNQLAAGNLYKMDFNENGEVTRNGAEFVADLTAAQLNTEGYRDAGYALTRINTVQTLYANGLTFQYDIANNNNFIHLDPECTFFVNDSRKDDNDYVEYGTVSAALNALGSDHRFTGTVAALINGNGFAEVLILNDTFKGNDDGSTVSGGSDGSITVSSPYIWESGYAQATLTVTRPEYINNDEILAYDYTVYVNGEPYYTDSDTIAAGSGSDVINWNNGTGTWSWLTRPIAQGSRITATMSFDETGTNALDDQHYILKVVDENGHEIKDQLARPSTTPTNYWYATMAAGGVDRTFEFKSGQYASGTFQVTKVENGTATMTDTATLGSDSSVNLPDLRADGTGYVIVTIDTTDLVEDTTVGFNFSNIEKPLSTWGVTGTNDEDLVLDFSTDDSTETGITAGTRKTITVSLASGSVSDNYKVYVSLDGVGGAILDGTTPESLGTIPVNSNITYGVEDVTVTVYPKLAVVAAEWDESAIILRFNGNVTSTDGSFDQFSGGTGDYNLVSANSATVYDVSASGSVLTISVKDAILEVGDVLGLTNEICQAGNDLSGTTLNGNVLTGINLDLEADGYISIGGTTLLKY